MTTERWCSMKEVCEHLGASHDSVALWIKNKNLPAIKKGGLWRFKMSEVEKWRESDDALNTKAGKKIYAEKAHRHQANKAVMKKTTVSYKPLFKLLIDKGLKKKDLAEKAKISIATITKMGTVGSHVNTDVLERICVALNCKLDDIIEIVQVSDGEMMSEESAYSESDCLELNPIACKEYGLTRTEQEIVHFIYEQLQYYRDNPPSFMVNQARSDFGIGSYEEAKKSIPTDRFYSLVLNEVIENWGQEGCDFAQKHIPFKTIESGYFEPEDETFGELTMI